MREILADIPEWLETIVEKLHAKEPADRFQSAKEVADLLARCQSELRTTGAVTSVAHQRAGSPGASGTMRGGHRPPKLHAIPTATPSPPRRNANRKWWLLGSGAMLALVVVIGTLLIQGKLLVGTNKHTGQTGPLGVAASNAPPNVWPKDAPPPAIAPFDAEQAKKHQEAWAELPQGAGGVHELHRHEVRPHPAGRVHDGEHAGGDRRGAQVRGRKSRDWQECIQSEAPQHKVILTQPIYLGVHEVTQGQYEKVMGKNPSWFRRDGAGKDRRRRDGHDQPPGGNGELERRGRILCETEPAGATQAVLFPVPARR